MRLSPTVLICAAGLATLGVSQALAPTAYAQSAPAVPAVRVSVLNLDTRQTLGCVELTGRLVNTGQQTLSYPSVMCIFVNTAGREVGRAEGYLLAGPVAPGQSVGFRASAPNLPAFAAVSLRLREAGRPAAVQADNCRMTVR